MAKKEVEEFREPYAVLCMQCPGYETGSAPLSVLDDPTKYTVTMQCRRCQASLAHGILVKDLETAESQLVLSQRVVMQLHNKVSVLEAKVSVYEKDREAFANSHRHPPMMMAVPFGFRGY